MEQGVGQDERGIPSSDDLEGPFWASSSLISPQSKGSMGPGKCSLEPNLDRCLGIQDPRIPCSNGIGPASEDRAGLFPKSILPRVGCFQGSERDAPRPKGWLFSGEGGHLLRASIYALVLVLTDVRGRSGDGRHTSRAKAPRLTGEGPAEAKGSEPAWGGGCERGAAPGTGKGRELRPKSGQCLRSQEGGL